MEFSLLKSGPLCFMSLTISRIVTATAKFVNFVTIVQASAYGYLRTFATKFNRGLSEKLFSFMASFILEAPEHMNIHIRLLKRPCKYYIQAGTMIPSISYGRMIFGEIYLDGLAEEWMVVFNGGEFG